VTELEQYVKELENSKFEADQVVRRLTFENQTLKRMHLEAVVQLQALQAKLGPTMPNPSAFMSAHQL